MHAGTFNFNENCVTSAENVQLLGLCIDNKLHFNKNIIYSVSISKVALESSIVLDFIYHTR